MGKSPGKWIKTVLFGKKSSKSNLSKDSKLDKKTSITINSHTKDLDADSMAISSPVRHVINVSGEHTQLENSLSSNLMHDTSENTRNTSNATNDDELIRLEHAATKAQAAFRGYLARRAFWALKGIIRLQALARGHLVRRQAVATLTCMRAIVDFQALVRGQRVRVSIDGSQVLQKRTIGDPVHKERANLLQTSLKSEKLSKNTFAFKLVTSSKTTMPLNIQYDPNELNSVNNWLERWSSSNFWDPLPQPKKTLDTKPIRKHTKHMKSQSQETESTRTKRSIRKVPSPSLDKVNHSLTKISLSASGGSEKSTVEKVNDLNVTVAEPSPVENETNEKENQKTRRRQSFPAKQECSDNNTPTVPSYMAATESAKAKLRAQAAEDGGDNGFVRRHSLPSSTGKLSLQSPRVQKLLHANEKGVSAGWRR